MASHFFNFHIHHNHNEINLLNVDEKRYKYGKLLIFACFFLYTASMAAKGIFAAQMKFIKDLWDLEYAKVSMANTYYFVAYGLVQVILFFVMDKISMRKYILWTVPFAAITTALIGLSTGIEHVWIYFGLSGAFQAGIYAGCNLILTRYLPVKLLTTANSTMTLGYAVGTVVAYLLSALFIGLGDQTWRIPYFIIGAIFLSSVVTFWIVVLIGKRFSKVNNLLDKKYIENIKKNKESAKDDTDPLITVENTRKKIVFYTVDLVMAFLITALYYCVMNYITSLLVDVHNFPQDTSIYVAIIAPIAIAVGPIMTIRACDKHKDFIRQAIWFTLIIIPIPLVMAFFYKISWILALTLSIVYVVIANGIKAIILSVMAYKMRSVMNAGAYSAISNSIASVSAGVTPTIMGKIIDVSGWSTAYFATFGLTVVVFIALIFIDIAVRKDYRKAHDNGSNEKINLD